MRGKRRIGQLLRDDRGATAIEYGLILALVVIALVMAMVAMGEASGTLWDDVSNKVTAATPN